MPPPFATLGAASRFSWGVGMDEVEFPRSAASVPCHRRIAVASAAASEGVSSSGAAAGTAQQRRRRTSEGGCDTSWSLSHAFHRNPLERFCTSQAATDDIHVIDETDSCPSDARGRGCLEPAFSSGTDNAGPVATKKVPLQRLADLASIPVGSLLLGVVAEVHSDDILVHLPDGLVGWVPRAHAFPSLEEPRSSSSLTNRETGSVSASRFRKVSGGCSATTGGNETSPLLATESGDDARREEDIREAPGQQRARKCVARRVERSVSLTAHYSVGQVVQCVVIAVGGNEGSQTSRCVRTGDGQALLLSLRPSIFNAGLTVEAVQPGMVLPASLSSVEDHGYVFSVGVEGLSAFLPSSALQNCSSSRPEGPSGDSSTAEAPLFSTLPLRLHTIVSLRVDSVNAAAEVLLCSLPGTNGQRSRVSEAKDQLSRWQEEPYLALPKTVTWAAVKPGCLVEARVQQVYRWRGRREKCRSAEAFTRLNEGKKASSLKDNEDLDEKICQKGSYIVGVRVVCLGGDIVGTVLQPHFAHPLLQLDSSCSSGLQPGVAATGSKGPKQSKEGARKAPVQGGNGEEEGSSGLGQDNGCPFTTCGGLSRVANGERKQPKEAAGTTQETAGDCARDGARFEDIQAQYSQVCSSRLMGVGARILARVTCVLSSTTGHLYLSMLPHIMMWRPYQLPCSVTELLPGRRLLGEVAYVMSVFPSQDILSGSSCALKKHSSSSSHASGGGGEVRVLLKKRHEQRASRQNKLGLQAKKKRTGVCAETAGETCNSHDVDEHLVTDKFDSGTTDTSERSALSSQKSAGCKVDGTVSARAPKNDPSLSMSWEERQAHSWILVKLPRCMMATPRGSFSSEDRQYSGKRKRMEADTKVKHSKEAALIDLAPGDVLWSAFRGTEDGSCFCRVLYFDHFAGEVVGGNASRLLKDNVVLSPFDVSPGQIITVSVLRWRLPTESNKPKHDKGKKRVHAPPVGIFVRLSPYLTAFVPLYLLMDTPVSSFPPHVVPGSRLKLRVLERVCCRSCTQLDMDSAFAPFMRRSDNKHAGKRQLVLGSSGMSILQHPCLGGAVNIYLDGSACGSSIMGMGGGGGGRLVLTGKKTFLRDPHPLTSLLTDTAFGERVDTQQAGYLHGALTALGYVQKILYKKGVSGADSERDGVDGSEESLPSIVVGFYNGLTGRLSQDEVRRAVVEEGRSLKLGTGVKVRVLGVDTKCRCLRLTTDMSSEVAQVAIATARRKKEKLALRLCPGAIVEKERLTLLALADEGVLVAVEEKRRGDASQSANSTLATAAPVDAAVDKLHGWMHQRGSVVGLGFIPKMHLSDGVRLAEELYSVLRVGKKFPLDAVVLSSAATIRPGAAVQIWESRTALVRKEDTFSREECNGRAIFGHSEGGIEDVLARVKHALQQRSAAGGDGPQKGNALETLIRDVYILSCKPTLRGSAADGTFLRDFKAVEKLKTNLRTSPPILWGYVRKIGPYGLLVSFGAWQLTGLLPYGNISDTFIEDENHLRQLYREGMTVRGCLVAVSESADENSKQELYAEANANNRIDEARGKRDALRFLVDIRPKRLSDLQRHQRLEGGTRAAASAGIQMLRGLFEHRSVAAILKQSRDLDERLAEAALEGSFGLKETMLKTTTLAAGVVSENTLSESMNLTVCLRPGQLVWGRILPNDFPNCVLLELQSPRREERSDICSKHALRSVKGVTGVVLEHQLPEGETIESIRAKSRQCAHQDPIPCIVLDFDPVTGIADVSCRRRLVDSLQIAHNTVQAAARRQHNNYVHYILVGVSSEASGGQKAGGLCDIPCITEETVGPDSVKKWQVEVVTQEMNGLLHGDTAGVENESDSSSSLRRAAVSSHMEAGRVTSEMNAVAQEQETFPQPLTEAIPEKVIKRMQSFCEAHPVPCATVQLESAAYSVLSTNFDVVIYFSKSKRLRQERLEALLACAAHPGSGEEAAKPLHVMPDGSVRMDTTHMSKSATQFSGGTFVPDGLYVRLPLLLFSTSCHNNTLLPVQPTAEALKEAPEDAGWRVALSPVQRSLDLKSNYAGGPVLLTGGCWPIRECRLEQHRQRSSGRRSQRGARVKGTYDSGAAADSAELKNNRLPAKKKLSASELDDGVEQSAAPGQILRARITHVGACVAFARLKKPKQQLLLRLHAADALPPLCVQTAQATRDAGGFVLEEETRHASTPGDLNREESTCTEMKAQRLDSFASEDGGATSAGEDTHWGQESGWTSWFPPFRSSSTSSTDRSASFGNPLKRLTAGMLVDVKVLRLRQIHRVTAETAARADSCAAAGGSGVAACDEHCVRNGEGGKAVANGKSQQQGSMVRSRKNQWVADVELIGLIEKRRAGGRVGTAHYTAIPGGESTSLTSCSVDGAQRSSAKLAKAQGESDLIRNKLAWLYSPRWAVVESVSDRYLTVHCGVRSELVSSLSLQQITNIHFKRNKPTESCLSYEDHVYAGAYLNGRGRVHRLDATRDRHVLQDLRAGFAPGDMVCVRLLPMLNLEKGAFEEAVESATRAARRADEEVTKEDCTSSDKEHFHKYTRRIASSVARYTVVASTVASAEKFLATAAEAGGQLMADESQPAASACTRECVPFLLVETSFDAVGCALDAWARWRYSPGMLCWGVVHHMLPPPFAVAVQVCEVVIKRNFWPLLKNKFQSSTGRDHTQMSDEEDGQQTSRLKVSSSGDRNSLVHLPVLAAVHMTEVTDGWHSDPVEHLKLRVGQLVKVRIMPVLKAQHAQQQLKHKKTESRSGLPLEASLRMSIVEDICKPKPSTGQKHNELLTFDQVKVGDRVSGYIISTGNAGVFVAISRCLTLRIRLQNLCCSMSPQDESQRTHSAIAGTVTGAQAQELYPVGRTLRGIRVVELHPETRRIEGSLKDKTSNVLTRRSISSDEHTPANKRRKTKTVMDVARVCPDCDSVIGTHVSSGFDVGDVCEGRIKAIESFGLFISLLESPRRDTKAEGESTMDVLCHLRDVGGVTEEQRRSILGKLKIGDLVKTRVIRTDKVTGRVWVSLDNSIFEREENSHEQPGDLQAEAAPGELVRYSEPLGGMISTLKGAAIDEYINKGEKHNHTVKTQEKHSDDKEYHYTVQGSSCAWSTAISGAEDVNNEGFEGRGDLFAGCQSAAVRDAQCGGHVTRHGPARSNSFEQVEEFCEDASENPMLLDQDDQRRKKEEEIRLVEEDNINRSWMENPRTPEDFEKLILVSGNSAAVWISYMAYYLKLGDLARARQVAERAVVHINYREEQQRLDVWVAYLNMECVYGDAVETLFRRAIQYNDAKKIYYQMTFIFEKAHKLVEARSACESCCARFPESQKMWIRHLTLLYTSVKDLSAARELMLKALLRLPRRKHVAFAASCARLEYKFGSKERGQTYFEKLLAEHPKRTDLWSQYLDAHISANTPPRCQRADVQSIRILFERATALQLKPMKMKFLFTRWLLFEKQHGTVDGQFLVRARAREYIQAMEARLAGQ